MQPQSLPAPLPNGIRSSPAQPRSASLPVLVLESAIAAVSILLVVAGLAVASLFRPPVQFVGIAAVLLAVGSLAARVAALGRRLRSASARLQALSRSPILGIATWRGDGALIEANDAFFSMIGESRERAGLINSSNIALHTPTGAEPNLSTTREGFVERAIVTPDGGTRYLAWGTRESGPHEVLTFAVDVTDRVTSEMRLRKAREVLEQRVRELEQRGAAAGDANDARTEQSVVSLAERLATANAELEAFSYSVAHDLRAPLRTIDGFSRELLATFGGQLGEQGDQYLNRIRAGTQRMGNLIDALLELSRVSRVEVRRQHTDVSAAARAVVEERQLRLAPHAEVRIADNLTANADPRLLHVILENLLGNALKFSAKRQNPLIELFSIADGATPTFCVRDNGAGFDMRYAEKLFTPFHRMHSPAQFQGTGIGLALVHRAITRHGGTIRAESEPGRGTSILFTLEPAGPSQPAETRT